MIKIGLTGNIASGKSTIRKIIEEFGISTICADSVVHDLMKNNDSLKKNIINAFSKYDILTENKLDRKKLGKIVFSSDEEKKKLEKLIHPMVIKEIQKFFELNTHEKLVFVDVPLLFEGHLEYLFDKILLVFANDKIRFERIKKRNNFDDDYIYKVMKSQLSQKIKKDKSDLIIFNENKTIEDLKQELKTIISEIL